MSFLDELRAYASALRQQDAHQAQDVGARISRVETACQAVWTYLEDLARQLNVIEPDGPAFSIDGKTPWPPMKLHGFQFDARKKSLRGQEVFDYLVLHWQSSPRHGKPLVQKVTVNFPPDLERVRRRLALGNVEHEIEDVRHPDSNALLAYEFHLSTAARGSVKIVAQHDEDELQFQMLNFERFERLETRYLATHVNRPLLDEMAKRVVGQASRFG